MHVHNHGHGPAHSQAIHWARLYDVGAGHLAKSLHQGLIEQAAIVPGERILDVGCGPGRLALRAAAATGPTGECCGIDLSPEMIGLAREKAARAGLAVRFEVASVDALPFPAGHFDVVISNLVLHHLPEETKRKGFEEIRRVLAPGGRFLACDFKANPGHGIGHILSMFGLRSGSEHAAYLRDLIIAAGFESVDVVPARKSAFAVVRARAPKAAQ